MTNQSTSKDDKKPSKDDYFVSGEDYVKMLDELLGTVDKGN